MNSRTNSKRSKFFMLAVALLLLFSLLCSFCSCSHNKHSFGEWSILVEPSCTSSGERVRYCGECSWVDVETIPATGHKEVGGVCTNCDKIMDGYKALIHYVKTNGEKSKNTYSVSMDATNNDFKQMIRYNADTLELSFLEIGTSLITVVYVDPSEAKQDVGLIFSASGNTYNSIGYIYAATFDVNSSTIYGYKSDAPIDLEDLFNTSTRLLLTDFITVLKRTETGVTMEMLGFQMIK